MIPALNEERRLPATIARTVDYLARRPWSSAVVIVDNGSIDRTVEAAELSPSHPVPVHVIGCSRRGKGAALRRGMLTGTSRFVGFMDADLASPVEVLDSVMPLLEQGKPAVIGSRHVSSSSFVTKQGLVRRFGGAAFRSIAHTVVASVADTQCGFKFFQGDAARRLVAQCQLDGFAFDLELLALFQRAGHTITEVPVRWTDVEGSTFRVLHDGWRSVTDVVRLQRALVTLEGDARHG